MKKPDLFKAFKDKETRKVRIITLAGTLTFITAFIVVYAIYGKELLAFVKDAVGFRAWLNSFGGWAESVFVGIRAIQTVIKIVPAEPLEIGAGYAFGTLWGTIWCMLGTEIGSAVIILLTKLFGKKLVLNFISQEKIDSYKFLQDNKRMGITLFMIYLVPGTPKDVITYLIGLTKMKLWVFLVITGIARIPSIITSTICGAALVENNLTFAIIIYAATVVVSGAGLLIYKKVEAKRDKAAEENAATAS